MMRSSRPRASFPVMELEPERNPRGELPCGLFDAPVLLRRMGNTPEDQAVSVRQDVDDRDEEGGVRGDSGLYPRRSHAERKG